MSAKRKTVLINKSHAKQSYVDGSLILHKRTQTRTSFSVELKTIPRNNTIDCIKIRCRQAKKGNFNFVQVEFSMRFVHVCVSGVSLKVKHK